MSPCQHTAHGVLRRVFLIVIAASLVAGCGDSRRSTLHGRYGGTLELATTTDMESLDPAIAYAVAPWGFIRLLYTGLMDYDDHAKLIPHGATHWTLSPDGKVYTFYLRPDVHFEGPLTHNRAVTSHDYAYEIKRVLTKEVASPAADFYTVIEGGQEYHDGKASSIAGLQSPDDLTLVVKIKHAEPSFLNVMAMPFAYAVPHEVVERYGKTDFQLHAEGSGPFTLAYWHRLVDIRFRRNPHYWEPGLPYLDGIHQTFDITSLNSMMLFETGGIDLSTVPAADFDRITHEPKFRGEIVKASQIAIFYVSLNCEMPPLDNLQVRQAINYAVNREHILTLINHRGVLAKGVLPPGMPGYNPALQGYPYDPGRAKQLLAQSGHSSGIKLMLWVPSDQTGDRQAISQAIQEDLKNVGIEVELKQVQFPVWTTAVSQERKVQVSVNDWYQDFPDPSDFLDVLLNSSRALPADGENNAFYKSHAMDSLLNAAATELNPARRLKLYQQADQLAVHDAPWIYLYYPVDYELHQPWVHDYTLHPVWPTKFEQIWLSR